jgi:starch-binding outer membrane protein, SusD/RagB family
MKNNITYITLLLAGTLASCSKSFLDRPSQNNPTEDTYYTTAAQVNAATGFLYNQPWYGYIDKAYHCIGEVYSGNMLTSAGDPNYGNNTYVYMTVESTDGQDLNAWTAFYQVAGNATVLLNTLKQKGNATYLLQGEAECEFIRGAAYFYIGRVYGDAPIVADPVALAGSGNYNVPRYLQKDVLRFALTDFLNAAQVLPSTPYEAGRVTKWSALGMAAKLYLYEGNYDSAAYYANEVMQSGQYSLFPDYQGMFTLTADNNNQESLFALQWVQAGGYSYANAIQAYAGPSDLLNPDFGTGYSSVIPTIDLLNSYQTGDNRKAWSIMQEGFSNPVWTNKNFPNGYTYDTALNGAPDDATTITTGTRSSSLKYIAGPASAIGTTNTQGGNSLCIYVLRYADILLIYAESILGVNASTSDAGALAAFNLVHQRAGLPPVTSITKSMILAERRAEFAFESDYWYDIQRQGFTAATAIINAQERGTYSGTGINHVTASFTQASQLYMPIPSDEVVADPELGKPAVPYY